MEKEIKMLIKNEGMVHESGNLYHLDIFGSEESVLLDKNILKTQSMMLEHYLRRVRSENYFVYKIEELDELPFDAGYGYRISCVKLGTPTFIIKKRKQLKPGALN